MLFYESERSDQHNYLYCQRDHNFNFPAHLHHSFEFLCVQSGTLACTLETEQYEVHPGEALLVLPDQIHSYRTIGESQSVLWVFSTDWVPEFISQLGQREFITPVFRMEAAPLMELLAAVAARPEQLHQGRSFHAEHRGDKLPLAQLRNKFWHPGGRKHP